MEGASGDGSGDNSQLDNSYLQGQYVVEGTDDDTVASGDNEEEQKDKSPLREQDRFLPIANVARIMKKSIPKTGKIAKDAKECVQECVSEFISFITSEASERCHQEKRKTINGEDILFAMSTLGFDSYVEPLKLYLQKYREAMKGDKGATNRHEEMDEMGDETYGLSQGLTANILSTDQGSQQGVIFTSFANQSYAM
ncbi:hypothetical protein ACJMK2_015605 [Sinanodonta woodiana]|uniref:Nuclear transcription factor Y subunit beta n=1 Tax=Sinanodonta woodiana TaxID=1069815 RepID=A0ABD3US58_SINWO